VITVVAALTAPALADDDTDDDGFKPLPRRSVGFGFQGHGTRIGGRSEGGFGPTLEVALGRDRWQYFAEASIASTGMNDWTTPAVETRVNGRLVRGGVGLRWIARQFAPDESGGVELFLLSALGAQRFYFEDGGRLSRPEIALGFGIQGRVFSGPRIAFRFDVRAVFTPNSRESALVACRGDCVMETGSSTGFLTGIVLAW